MQTYADVCVWTSLHIRVSPLPWAARLRNAILPVGAASCTRGVAQQHISAPLISSALLRGHRSYITDCTPFTQPLTPPPLTTNRLLMAPSSVEKEPVISQSGWLMLARVALWRECVFVLIGGDICSSSSICTFALKTKVKEWVHFFSGFI